MSSNQSTARRRWKLLIETISTNRNNIGRSEVSGRHFSGYSLVFQEVEELKNENSQGDHIWRKFRLLHGPSCSVIDVRVYSNKISLDDLTGFNNTGNICIWPSEDVLAHYLLKSSKIDFRNIHRLCEIGGGMTCLAGIALAIEMEIDDVVLTDGNERSVENIQAIINENFEKFKSKNISARRLRWDCLDLDNHDDQWSNYFDLIICADCLFFKESHTSLVNSIVKMLSPTGTCIIVAPERGGSLSSFIASLKLRQDCKFSISDRFDEELWQASQSLAISLGNAFDRDQHYPFLIEICRNIQQ